MRIRGWRLVPQGHAHNTSCSYPSDPNQALIPEVIATKKLQFPYPTEPVLLCVEILSSEDGIGAMLAKCERYHAWGVPYCWVIDPEKQTAWQYHSGGDPEKVDRTGTLKAGDLIVSMGGLFADIH